MVRTRWIGAIALAGALVAGACGQGDPGAQVSTGTGEDATARLEASFAATLGGPYGVIGDTTYTDAGGAPIDFGQASPDATCLKLPEPGSDRLRIDRPNRVIVLEDRDSGAVTGVFDTGALVGYVPRDEFADPSLVSAPWVRLHLDDQTARTAIVTSLGTAAPMLSSPDDLGPDPILDPVRASVASADVVGPEEVEGVPTTRVVATIDGARFDEALREQTRRRDESSTGRGLPGTGTPGSRPPATATPADEIPTVDAWIDDDGHLRQVVVAAAVDGADAPTDPVSGRTPTRITVTYRFREVGVPLPVGIPAADEVADLGVQPAAVLRPRPECEALSAGGTSGAGGSGPGAPAAPDLEAWRACIEETYANKTVDEYVRDSANGPLGTTLSVVGGGAGAGVPLTRCPYPAAGTGAPAPGIPVDPAPATIPGPP